MKTARRQAIKEIASMFTTLQADQYASSACHAAGRMPRARVQPCTVGEGPLNAGPRLTGAATGIVDRHRANERFARETEPVRDFLVRNAIRLTHQRADAEDLVQETLLKAYVSFDSYREGTQLKSWLARIMSNAWIDRHRATRRRPAEQLSAEVADVRLDFDVSPLSRSWVDSAETQALQSLPGDAESALQMLPGELRDIVYYACIAGYRNTEIAALLGIPVGTVGSRLHRGKALLREALAPPSDESQLPVQ